MILGKISAVDNDNGVTLTIDGESSPTTKKFHYLASYSPTADDRVLVEEVGDSYVVIGKVISAYADSGKAKSAAEDESGNNIKASYGSDLGYPTNSRTLKIKNKNGTLIGTGVTIKNVDTVYNNRNSGYPVRFGMNNSDLYFSMDGYSWKKVTGTNA